MSDLESNLVEELIDRVGDGDVEAGKELLVKFVLGSDRGWVDPRVQRFVLDGLWRFAVEEEPLERSLGVETKVSPSKGGRPKQHNSERVVALFLLLETHANYGTEDAYSEVSRVTGTHRRTIQNYRRRHDSRLCEYTSDPLMDGLGRRSLIDLADPIPDEIQKLLDAA